MNVAATLDSVRILGSWVSLGTALAALMFIVVYSVLAKWYTSAEGRLLMSFAALVTFLTGHAGITGLVAPNSIVAREIRVAGLAVFGGLMLVQTALLWRAQMRRRKGGIK